MSVIDRNAGNLDNRRDRIHPGATRGRCAGGLGLAGVLALIALHSTPAAAQNARIEGISQIASAPINRIDTVRQPLAVVAAPRQPVVAVTGPALRLQSLPSVVRAAPLTGRIQAIDPSLLGGRLERLKVAPNPTSGAAPLGARPPAALAPTVRAINAGRVPEAGQTGWAGRPIAGGVGGSYTAKAGGLAALVTPGARTAGAIGAQIARVAIGRARTTTVDLYGDGLIQLALDKGSALAEALPADPEEGDRPSGCVASAGDRVALTVDTASAVVDGVINMAGKTEARGVEVRNGRIVLVGDSPAAGATAAPNDPAVGDTATPIGGGANSDDYFDPEGTNIGARPRDQAVGSGGETPGDTSGDTSADESAGPDSDQIGRVASWLAAQKSPAAAGFDAASGRPARLIDVTPIGGLVLWAATADALAGLAPAAGGDATAAAEEDPALAILRETCPDVALASMSWQSTPSEAVFNVAPELVPYSADAYCGGYRVTSAARGAFSAYDVFTFVTRDFWTDLAQARQATPIPELAPLFGVAGDGSRHGAP